MNNAKDYELIPFPRIEAETGLKLQDYDNGCYFVNFPNDPDVYDDPNKNVFSVYRGDTVIHDLDLCLTGYGNDNRAVLVIGNLTVKGNIDMYGSDIGYPLYLYVTGNLIVDNLVVVSALADIIVKGNLAVNKNLYQADIENGNLHCGGNFRAKNVYLEKSGLMVGGSASADKFYYRINIFRGETPATPLKELGINLADETKLNPIACGESGIKVFEELIALEEGDMDYDELTREEQKRIDRLYETNKIFVAEVYRGIDLRSHLLAETLLKGEDVFL